MGLILGTVVAVFLILKTQENKIENTKTLSNSAKTNPTVSKVTNNLNFQPLEITEPENSTIISKNLVTIKGKAVKNSLIVIQSSTKEITLENDKENFSAEIPLARGENVINITVYNKKIQLEPQTKELKIYYLDEQ